MKGELKMKKSIIGMAATALGSVVVMVGVSYMYAKNIGTVKGKVDKFKSYYNMLNQWLLLKQEGKSLEKYFVENGYKTIAIYGMGEMGIRLYEELRNSSIEVKYAIDKNSSNTYSELTVVELEGELKSVDAVIVSAVFAFEEIEKELEKVIDCTVISLEDVVYES